MGKRKHIGLFFSYNSNWIGGTYYWLNWVNALNALPVDEKPMISIITRTKKEYSYLANETNYPYLRYVKNNSGYSLLQKALNAIFLRIIHKRIFTSRLADGFDAVLPVSIDNEYLSLIPDNKKINWFPDFQYAHLPEFYTPIKLVEAQQRAVAAAYLSYKLMLSSEDAKNDFLKLFPLSKAKLYVLPFTVTHPDISKIDTSMVLSKFGITKPYFYVPNQYWAHKNHIVVIEAVEKIVASGNKDILVLFSGKEWDDRNPDYVPTLKTLVIEKHLSANIKFLGFLERKEQLLLMREAKAIIQPSLFEGWSTVIEDAKALNKFVIASNIAVNQEQIQCNCSFFDPNDCESLVRVINNDKFDCVMLNYEENKLHQAQKFMKMLND